MKAAEAKQLKAGDRVRSRRLGAGVVESNGSSQVVIAWFPGNLVRIAHGEMAAIHRWDEEPLPSVGPSEAREG